MGWLKPVASWSLTLPENISSMSVTDDVRVLLVRLRELAVGAAVGAARRTAPWRPWTVNGITAGYWEEFDRYTFATVKGAGHTVPQYQPLTSFDTSRAPNMRGTGTRCTRYTATAQTAPPHLLLPPACRGTARRGGGTSPSASRRWRRRAAT